MISISIDRSITFSCFSPSRSIHLYLARLCVCKSASLQVRESINPSIYPSIYLSYTFCSSRICSTRDIPTQLDRESRNELVSLCAPSAVCISLSVGE